MSDEEQNIERSFADLARETYGDDYHGDDTVSDDVTEDKALTLDAAYERLQEAKDNTEQEMEDAGLGKPPAESAPDEEAETNLESTPDTGETDGAMWSNEDVQTISLIQQEHQRFQQDLAAFAQAKQQDLKAIAGDDKKKLSELQSQMQEAERELRERYEALNQAAQGVKEKADNRTRQQAEKALKREKAKLEKAVPGLDRKALKTYLTGQIGFAESDLKNITDHRALLVAEKARKYDELMKNKPKPKVRAVKGGQSTQKPQNNIQKLEARLKQTGKIDDAYKLLEAKKAMGARA